MKMGTELYKYYKKKEEKLCGLHKKEQKDKKG